MHFVNVLTLIKYEYFSRYENGLCGEHRHYYVLEFSIFIHELWNFSNRAMNFLLFWLGGLGGPIDCHDNNTIVQDELKTTKNCVPFKKVFEQKEYVNCLTK